MTHYNEIPSHSRFMAGVRSRNDADYASFARLTCCVGWWIAFGVVLLVQVL